MNGFKGIQNTEGRTLGSQNKVTAKVKESFALLLEDNLQSLQADLDSLRPIERLKIMIEIAGFVIPKMKAIDISGIQERESVQPLVIDISKWS
jgi:hypothetical protein